MKKVVKTIGNILTGALLTLAVCLSFLFVLNVHAGFEEAPEEANDYQSYSYIDEVGIVPVPIFKRIDKIEFRYFGMGRNEKGEVCLVGIRTVTYTDGSKVNFSEYYQLKELMFGDHIGITEFKDQIESEI